MWHLCERSPTESKRSVWALAGGEVEEREEVGTVSGGARGWRRFARFPGHLRAPRRRQRRSASIYGADSRSCVPYSIERIHFDDYVEIEIEVGIFWCLEIFKLRFIVLRDGQILEDSRQSIYYEWSQENVDAID